VGAKDVDPRKPILEGTHVEPWGVVGRGNVEDDADPVVVEGSRYQGRD